MKKFFLVVLIIVCFGLLTACNNVEQNMSEEKVVNSDVEDNQQISGNEVGEEENLVPPAFPDGG